MNKDKLNVLLVEDVLMVQYAVKTALSSLSWHIDVADTGKSAVALAEDHEYDLVLMDIGLPDISGIEATKMIRKQKPALPIIALTAHSDNEYWEAATAAGMDAYIQKPITVEKVMEIFEDALAS